MAREREVKVVILGEDRGATKALNELNTAGGKTETTFGKVGSAGSTMTKTLTPAAIGAGLAFRQAWQEYDRGSDTIISKTGASGEALKSLEGSMKTVSKGVTTGMGDIGAVVGDLNTALGITGKPLEELTSQVVKLGELGEEFNTTSFTRFMGDWGIATEDASGALDRLYKIGQVTGIGVGKLMEQTVQFGAPMRALGFSVDDSTAMIAKFHKEGVNTEAVLAGMKVGLGKMAKAGEEPAATFWRLTSEIKNAATEGEAMGIAAEAFGTRAGPDLAAAIREGRFEFEDLVSGLGDTKGAIDTTHKATLDWSDKLGMLKNQLFTVIGPIGEIGMGVAGLAAGLGPAMMAIGKIGPALMGAAASAGGFVVSMVTAGISAAAAAIPVLIAWAPVILLVAAVGAAAYLLYRNWDTVFGFIKEIASSAFDWIKDNLDKIAMVVLAPIAPLILLVQHWDEAWGLVKNIASVAWKWLRETVWGGITDVVGFLAGLPGRAVGALSNLQDEIARVARRAMSAMWDAVWEGAADLLSLVAGIPGRVAGALRGLGGTLYDIGYSVVRAMASGIGDAIGWVLSAAGNLVNRVKDKLMFWRSPPDAFGEWIGGGLVGGLASGLDDDRAAAAAGGLVDSVKRRFGGLTAPSLAGAMVEGASAGTGTGGGGNGDTYIINIAGSVVTERELIEAVHAGLLQKQRRVPGLALT